MELMLTPCTVQTDSRGREVTAHGTPAFPLGCYYDNLETEEVAWHWHEEMETIVVSEGEVVAKAGTEKYLLRQGEGMFINSGVLHAIKNVGTGFCSLHSFVFHPKLVAGSMDSIFWQKYVQPLKEDVCLNSAAFRQGTEWGGEVLKLLESAWQACARKKNGYEFDVRSSLSEMIFLLTQHRPSSLPAPSEKEARDAERVKRMLEYIHVHYSDALTLPQIAASAGLSSSECLRCFRSTIGLAPIQYVKQYRVQRAAEMLVGTPEKIVDIAMQCGFQDMSYFARSFRELKGCTPSRYREMMKREQSQSISRSREAAGDM
ncbi:MAG: AraC family transcriptional regulator [Eubacteriales bacterium]|nr:AraC family transcriptional regulator [Eubacteriales bacterium]